MFGCDLDDELKQQINQTLHFARVTFSEFHFVAAIEAAGAGDMEGAKSVINGQIMAWSTVDIEVSDIHPKLWQMSQSVTRGKKPE